MSTRPLLLRSLAVENVRCFSRKRLAFSPHLNWIVGDNGTGKTTLLESIHLLSHRRSFRMAHNAPLLRVGASAFSICGMFQRFGPMRVSANGAAPGRLSLTVQGVRAPAKGELFRMLPVIADSPQAARVIEAGANDRRRWLDGLLLRLFPSFSTVRREYLRAWRQWVCLLRKGARLQEKEGWAQLIVRYASEWLARRRQLVRLLNEELADESWAGKVELSIAPALPEERWLSSLLQADRLQQCPFPHLVSIEILWQGKDARLLGSRGQQRLCAFALRLSECALCADKLGVVPILILDDAFDALDRKRRQALKDRLMAYPGQVLVTTPEIAFEGEHLIRLHTEEVA